MYTFWGGQADHRISHSDYGKLLRQNKNGVRFSCCWRDDGRVIEDHIQVVLDKGAYL